MPHGHRGGRGRGGVWRKRLSPMEIVFPRYVLLSSINIIFDHLMESDRERERDLYRDIRVNNRRVYMVDMKVNRIVSRSIVYPAPLNLSVIVVIRFVLYKIDRVYLFYS